MKKYFLKIGTCISCMLLLSSFNANAEEEREPHQLAKKILDIGITKMASIDILEKDAARMASFFERITPHERLVFAHYCQQIFNKSDDVFKQLALKRKLVDELIKNITKENRSFMGGLEKLTPLEKIALNNFYEQMAKDADMADEKKKTEGKVENSSEKKGRE